MKPILFNTEMVRAILDGRKNETRRVIKPPVPESCELRIMESGYHAGEWHLYKDDPILDPANRSPWGAQYIPPYEPGDILYVRETWNYGYIETPDQPGTYDAWFEEWSWRTREEHSYLNAISRFWYKADGEDFGDVEMSWRPSIHMPREAARLFLRVTDVRAERLQEITDDGLDKEGIIPSLVHCGEQPSPNAIRAGKRKAFRDLWDSTIPRHPNKFKSYPYYWKFDPWVWVICFERCEKPEEDV